MRWSTAKWLARALLLSIKWWRDVGYLGLREWASRRRSNSSVSFRSFSHGRSNTRKGDRIETRTGLRDVLRSYELNEAFSDDGYNEIAEYSPSEERLRDCAEHHAGDFEKWMKENVDKESGLVPDYEMERIDSR